MQVDRIPRRLLYKWSDQGSEIEYGSDIPTPTPEIKCDPVQVEVPPPVPNTFELWGAGYPTGRIVRMAVINSFSVAVIGNVFNYSDGIRQEVNLRGTDFLGRTIEGSYFSQVIFRNSFYITPGNTLKPRRDLLIGSDRMVNPTVDTPCPKWRFTGGNCPPGSLDCGNCCLDCAALKASIEALTAAIAPYSRRNP